MKATDEQLRKQIQDRPKSNVGRAYQLALRDGKAELAEAHSTIRELEGVVRKLEAPPETKGILKVYWANGSTSTIKLSTMGPIKDLTGGGGFLVIPEDVNPNHGEVINLSKVLMISVK